MKKSMIKLTAILLLGVGVFSCEKEEIRPTTSATSISTSSEKMNGTRRAWYDNGEVPGNDGIDYGCKGSGGNYLADVVVSPSKYTIFEDLNNASNNGDLAEVKRIVSENKTDISHYINSDDLDRVLDNSSELKTRGKVSVGGRLYVVIERKGTVNSVYPMNF